MLIVDFISTVRNSRLFRQDASFVYRCENLALGLRAAGHTARLRHVSSFTGDGGGVAVLHRPQYSLTLSRLIRKLQRDGKRVIIDIDDLIFDPDLGYASPAVVNGIVPLRKIQRKFRRHRRALGLVDAVTVSTEPLAARARALLPGTPVQVIGNTVHHSWRTDDGATPPAPREPRTIVYHPGTRSHDRDFAGVAPALERFLAAHADVRLQITGHLDCDLNAREGQVARAPRVPFSEYAQRFHGAWVNIAPLESSPFNECKSALKVIEAGYWGIPTICSPNPDTERFRGAGAVIAHDGDAWQRALESLLEPDAYARETENLRARVVDRADVHAVARELVGLIDRLGAA